MPLIIGTLLTSVLLLVFLYWPGLSPLAIKITLFFIGVVSSVEVICFAIGRENCPPNIAGTAVAVTNFLVVTFAFGQVIVAKILDLTWDGLLLDQAKVYSIDSYQTSMMVLPIATLIALLLCFFLKETYCRPIVFLDSDRK